MMTKEVELELWTCCDFHPYLLLTAGWLKAVQVLMVLSLILCCLSFILFMFQLYTMRRGGLFYATGLCQLCTSECCSLGAEGKGGEGGQEDAGGPRNGHLVKGNNSQQPKNHLRCLHGTSLPPGTYRSCSLH